MFFNFSIDVIFTSNEENIAKKRKISMHNEMHRFPHYFLYCLSLYQELQTDIAFLILNTHA